MMKSSVSSCLLQNFAVHATRKPLPKPNLNLSLNLAVDTQGTENVFFLIAAFLYVFPDNSCAPSTLFSVSKQPQTPPFFL